MKFIALTAFFLLVGCEQTERPATDAQLTALGERFVKEKLKDPDSAEFKNQFIGKKGIPCGEVNAKNGFGGYNGFQRYMAGSKELTVMPQDMAPGEFEASWATFCK